jgi:hypothetical protein
MFNGVRIDSFSNLEPTNLIAFKLNQSHSISLAILSHNDRNLRFQLIFFFFFFCGGRTLRNTPGQLRRDLGQNSSAKQNNRFLLLFLEKKHT